MQTPAAATRALPTAQALIEHCLSGVWQIVAEKTVQKMAPRFVGEQGNYAIECLTELASAQEFKKLSKLGYREEKDPTAPRLDNLARGSLHNQARSPSQSRVDTLQGSLIQARSRSRTLRSSRFVSEFDSEGKKLKSHLQSLGLQRSIDMQQEQMRTIENKKWQDELTAIRKQEKYEQEVMQRMQKAAANLKQFKDNKKQFTYHYGGELTNVMPSKINGELASKLREMKGGQKVLPRDKNSLEPVSIANERLQEHQRQMKRKDSEKEVFEFSKQSLTLAEAFQDKSTISEGIKITEMKDGDPLTYEKKAKLPEGFRKYRLRDFKNITKQKSFRDFKATTNRKTSLLDLSSSEVENKEESKVLKPDANASRLTVRSRGLSEQALKSGETTQGFEIALGRNLPFIRTKGLRLYDIGPVNPNKTINFNLSSSRRSSNARGSRINIGDTSLYEETILND